MESEEYQKGYEAGRMEMMREDMEERTTDFSEIFSGSEAMGARRESEISRGDLIEITHLLKRALKEAWCQVTTVARKGWLWFEIEAKALIRAEHDADVARWETSLATIDGEDDDEPIPRYPQRRDHRSVVTTRPEGFNPESYLWMLQLYREDVEMTHARLAYPNADFSRPRRAVDFDPS